jgi:hypothetical protein
MALGAAVVTVGEGAGIYTKAWSIPLFLGGLILPWAWGRQIPEKL